MVSEQDQAVGALEEEGEEEGEEEVRPVGVSVGEGEEGLLVVELRA